MDTVANVSAQQGVVTVEYVGTAMDHGTGSEKTLLGVVLAGGRSSRMGQDKALLELSDGTTLLERQLRRLSSLLPKVVLSVVQHFWSVSCAGFRHFSRKWFFPCGTGTTRSCKRG